MSWEDDWLEASYEDANGGDVDTSVEDEGSDDDGVDETEGNDPSAEALLLAIFQKPTQGE